MGDITVTYGATPGIRVDAAGKISYDFDGHVHATGLDIDASTTGVIPDDRKVRWLRESDGATVADIGGFATANSGMIIDAPTVPAGGNPGIFVRAGSHIAELLGGDDSSDYVRGGTAFGPAARIHGPYPVDSGVLVAGGGSTINLAHNLGKTVYPFTAPEGGGPVSLVNDALMAYSYTRLSVNTTQFVFINNNAAGVFARIVLWVFLATLT